MIAFGGRRRSAYRPSPPAIAYAIRRAPANATLTVGVAQDLRWPSGSFDLVTSTLAVHHIPEADRAAAFAEMARVLRPCGRLPRQGRRRRAHDELHLCGAIMTRCRGE